MVKGGLIMKVICDYCNKEIKPSKIKLKEIKVTNEITNIFTINPLSKLSSYIIFVCYNVFIFAFRTLVRNFRYFISYLDEWLKVA